MACEISGLTTMPVIVRSLNDDEEAAIAMVDTNLRQCEKL
jgi:ParB-like chromosome segregation protein Spo0J